MITPIKNDEKDLLTEKIIGLCFKIHTEIGPGFIEKIYHNALIVLLEEEKINFETEKYFDVKFRNKKIGKFRCDLLIENKVIVELKAINGFLPKIFDLQFLSYLKASKIKTGLQINFGNKSCEVKRLSV
ncbi:MAG: GxxExxY protein [Bacteroidia bacterium]